MTDHGEALEMTWRVEVGLGSPELHTEAFQLQSASIESVRCKQVKEKIKLLCNKEEFIFFIKYVESNCV